MPIMRLVILLVAAGAAVSAAFLVSGMQKNSAITPIDTLSIAAAAEENEEPPLKVLVAKESLEVGQFVRAEHLSWEIWPEEANITSFFNEEEHPDQYEKFQGAVIRTKMLAGEPVTASKIVHPGQAGFMSAVLTPGMRAVSVEISSETAAGGFVYPNDHVDVLLTHEVDVTGPNGTDTETAVNTILNNVRVLAIDGYYQPVESEQGEAIVGHRATLELSKRDAMVLISAQRRGQLSLMLRAVTELQGKSGATLAGLSITRSVGGAEGVRVFEKGESVAPVSVPSAGSGARAAASQANGGVDR
jgi:pilus assembly protein CpaB